MLPGPSELMFKWLSYMPIHWHIHRYIVRPPFARKDIIPFYRCWWLVLDFLLETQMNWHDPNFPAMMRQPPVNPHALLLPTLLYVCLVVNSEFHIAKNQTPHDEVGTPLKAAWKMTGYGGAWTRLRRKSADRGNKTSRYCQSQTCFLSYAHSLVHHRVRNYYEVQLCNHYSTTSWCVHYACAFTTDGQWLSLCTLLL